MRHYTNALDAEAAAEVTLADVQDMPRSTGAYHGPTIVVPADPFENTDAADAPAPF